MDTEIIMRNQRGLITRDQALDAGLSRPKIDYRLRTGTWLRVQPRVYCHAVVTPDWFGRVLAATLTGGRVASHRTAAALWDLDMFRRPAVEVTQPNERRRARLAGVTVHRSTQWRARQETTRSGIACTGIERTIMDAAGTMSVSMTERLAEDAVRRDLTSFAKLATFLAWHGRQGRTGCGNLRAVLLERAPNARLPLSDFSRRVTQLLVRTGLPRPELEYRIYDGSGSFIMQADLAWPDLRKVVELDGLAWHFGRDAVERDRRKRGRARAEGWRIHEVLWSMYADDPAALAHQIATFLHS